MSNRLSQLQIKAPEEVVDQDVQILAALAQGRQGDGEATETVVQVQAELASGNQLFQVAIGGRNQANVRLHGLAAADPLELLLLQQPQRFRLGQRRHVADLIEEQCPARTLLELADPPPVRTREGALLVAEQFAL